MYRRKHKRKSAVPRDRKSTSFGEATARYAQDKNPAHQGGRGVSTMTLEQPLELTSRPVPAHTPERGGSSGAETGCHKCPFNQGTDDSNEEEPKTCGVTRKPVNVS